MPRFPLSLDDINDTVLVNPTRLVWRIERVGVRQMLPDLDLCHIKTEREAVTYLHYHAENAAYACGRYLHAECFVGKREETKTADVPYRGSVSYQHLRTWEEREYGPWPEWLQVLFLLTCPWMWWPKHRVVQNSEILSGFVGYTGTVKHTYVTTMMIDPFIEDHYGPLKRDGKLPHRIEMAAYDYPNATYRVR